MFFPSFASFRCFRLCFSLFFLKEQSLIKEKFIHILKRIVTSCVGLSFLLFPSFWLFAEILEEHLLNAKLYSFLFSLLDTRKKFEMNFGVFAEIFITFVPVFLFGEVTRGLEMMKHGETRFWCHSTNWNTLKKTFALRRMMSVL